MPPDEARKEPGTAAAFAADVFDFAASLPTLQFAKLISFFHLAATNGGTEVEFYIDASGRLRLQIETDGTDD